MPDGASGNDLVTWLIGIIVTVTLPYLGKQLLNSKDEQIKDLKEQNRANITELHALSTAVRDLVLELRARSERG